MTIKLSEYEALPGFNQVASALFKENNIDYNSFDRLFPDQVSNISSIGEFLERLPVLKNTELFVERLKNFNKFSPICVYGDYDGDGIMGTTIMCHALSKLGYNVHFYIPDRLKDGYGMQSDSIKEDIERYGTKLIITVDNGIASRSLVEVAKSYGVDVIVTDHHLPDGEKVPDTLIIDPKYNNDDFSDICGAYVALKLCYALYLEMAPNRMYIIETLVPFAGIATITDMMPMLCENREIVKITLDIINNIKYEKKDPLHKILYSLGAHNFVKSQTMIATEELISFSIGPAINAVSRVTGNVTNVVKKILECLERPWTYMPSYVSTNYTRQNMTTELFRDYVYDETYKNSSVFIYDSSKYDYSVKGILGLIANKVSNKYKVVSLIGTFKDNESVEFSGRSIPSYNLHEGIERIKNKYPELELSGGGHAQAMGIKFKAKDNNIVIFKEALENDILENSAEYNPVLFEYEPEMSEEILNTMEELQPYGAGFQKLKFAYSGTFFKYDTETKIAKIGAYDFRMFISQEELPDLLGTELDVIFNISYADSKGPIFNIIKE